MKLSRSEISNILNITDPFLMIDEVLQLETGVSAHSIKHISSEDWYLKCHLPDFVAMPGTLLTESMLQTMVLVIYSLLDNSKKTAFVTDLNVKFLANVNPPEDIHIKAKLDSFNRGLAVGHAKVLSGTKIICRGKFKYVCPHLFPNLSDR